MEFSFSIYLIVFILLFYFTTIKIDTKKGRIFAENINQIISYVMNFFEFKGFRIRIDIKLFDIKVSLLDGMKNRVKKQNKNL